MLFIWLILQWMVLWSWVLGKAWGSKGRLWIYYLLLNRILVLQRVFWKSNVLKYDRFVFSGPVWEEQDNVRAREGFQLRTWKANFHHCFVSVCMHWKFVCLWDQWLVWDCRYLVELLINPGMEALQAACVFSPEIAKTARKMGVKLISRPNVYLHK